MFKRLVESGRTDIYITVFERRKKLGEGMPYSADGANDEHITNVSSNEIPLLVTTLADWIPTVPKDTLDKFNIDPAKFNEYKVLPRLLFGQYLAAQFGLLQKQAKEAGVPFEVRYNTAVTDIIDQPDKETILVEVNDQGKLEFDHIIICSGHNWPCRDEEKVPGYFDSPYPPRKLELQLNHAVALKGSSLTAVDAIRTLSRHNGSFYKDDKGKLRYKLSDQSPDFKMVMHTRNGMLPAVRFHLEDSHLQNDCLLTKEQIAAHIEENGGFLSLDYIFEKNFKEPIEPKHPEFYQRIKDMTLEEFVDAMIGMREDIDAFELLNAECIEADKSIKRKRSVYWKEMLGVLSFALNYPAKYLSAEDMLRLQKTLMPLISIVIAYMPQSSSTEMLALHEARVLDLISVGADSEVEPVKEGGAVYHYKNEHGEEQSVYYQTYIDCAGQPRLNYEDLPFKSLVTNRIVSPARIQFKSAEEGQKALDAGEEVIKDQSGDYYLKVAGIKINDHFQVVDAYGALNERIYMMAVPYIGGYNPDYSGLDFCEEVSGIIIERLLA
ncbi:MAG: hypothetical protein EOP47_07115 [Sphingobacteriaceae bacterium]|nr:MAG: hypothetical protein EOP47_07115 [Sphingobacteriaceae bacterium]